jgi:hypothetical protein
MAEHTFTVGDRAEILDTENWEPECTTVLRPADIESLTSRGIITRKYYNISLEKLRYIGRRKCSCCHKVISGEAFFEDRNGGEFYCCTCYVKLFARCTTCGRTFPRTAMLEFNHTGRLYCSRCFEEVGRINVTIGTPKEKDVASLPLCVKNIPTEGAEKKAKAETFQIVGNSEDFKVGDICYALRNVKYNSKVYIYGLADRPDFSFRLGGLGGDYSDKVRAKIDDYFTGVAVYTEINDGDYDCTIGIVKSLREGRTQTVVNFLSSLAGIKPEEGVRKSAFNGRQTDLIEKILKI